MIPSVAISKTDGNLGVTSNTDRILAIIGPASAGALNVPTSLTTTNDVVDAFASGPLVEAAVHALTSGVPVVLTRCAATADGAYSSVTSAIAGTATAAAGATKPVDTFDVIVEILTGGALGTAGIEFRYSLDGGVNWSGAKSLGTSLTLTCEGGVSFTLAASAATLIAGDSWSCSTTAPKPASADLTPAYAALADYSGEWLRALVLADADATILAQADTFAKSFHDEGKYPEIVTNTRPRGAAEDRPTYQAALAAISGAVQSTEVACCVDQCEMVSGVTGYRLRRPTSIPFAIRTLKIDDSQDAAAKAEGALTNVFLTTYDGERKYHDERRYPGLDGLWFTTLRTWGGRPSSPGVYVNNPRVLSGAGSDYRYFQHSAIVNRVIETTFQRLEPRLSASILLNPEGTIREDVAQAIEASVNAELRTIYVASARTSGIVFALSRTDNVLSTDTLTFSVGVQPLGYLKKFLGKTGLVRVLPTN